MHVAIKIVFWAITAVALVVCVALVGAGVGLCVDGNCLPSDNRFQIGSWKDLPSSVGGQYFVFVTLFLLLLATIAVIVFLAVTGGDSRVLPMIVSVVGMLLTFINANVELYYAVGWLTIEFGSTHVIWINSWIVGGVFLYGVAGLYLVDLLLSACK